MSDVVFDVLSEIAENIEVIEKRFSAINSPGQFNATDEGRILLDAIAIRLMAIGEGVNKIQKTEAALLEKYPSVKWDDVIRFRHFIAHHYELMDFEIVFSICRNDLPVLSIAIKQMLADQYD